MRRKRKTQNKRERADGLMERTRATVALVNAQPSDELVKLAGFMELFHPNYPRKNLRQLLR